MKKSLLLPGSVLAVCLCLDINRVQNRQKVLDMWVGKNTFRIEKRNALDE